MDERFQQLKAIAPRIGSVEETGLSRSLLEELIAKHLHNSGALELRVLMEKLALSGMVLEPLLSFMREEGRVEVRRRAGDSVPHYALTEKGHAIAVRELSKNSYCGPAPVSLTDYNRVVKAQSLHSSTLRREEMGAAFADLLIRQQQLDLIGPALHSGRAIFFYGAPGTGKSAVGRRMVRLFKDEVLVPHALAIQDTVIPFYDPIIHQRVEHPGNEMRTSLDEGFDERYQLCRRPEVVTGGELTLEMLEVQFDASRLLHRLPVQILANNGLFMIDDLGRQRVSPRDLLNRWIVPMEEATDYLFIGGQHFAVAFDVALLFATNLNPLDLADDAFLRRIGYKIRFDPLDATEYRRLWERECTLRSIDYRAEVIDFLERRLHDATGVPLLPCLPRDLLELILDRTRYIGKRPELSEESIRWAWDAYFVRLQ